MDNCFATVRFYKWIGLKTKQLSLETKRAMRPWTAHLRKQAEDQTHNLNKPDCLKLSNYDRHWLKVLILTNIAKCVYVFIYLTVFLNFCTRLFCKFVTLTFNLPEQIFQMALLLLIENNCAKSFWNPCINVEVMAHTNPDGGTHASTPHTHAHMCTQIHIHQIKIVTPMSCSLQVGSTKMELNTEIRKKFTALLPTLEK